MLKYKGMTKQLLIVLLLYIKIVNSKIIEIPEIEYKLDLIGLLLTFGDNECYLRLLNQIIHRDNWVLIWTITPGMYIWLKFIYKLIKKDNITFQELDNYDKRYRYTIYHHDDINNISKDTSTIRNIVAKGYVSNYFSSNFNPRDIFDKTRAIRRLTKLKLIKLNNIEENNTIKQPFIEWFWLWPNIINILLTIVMILIEDWYSFSIITSHLFCNVLLHILLLNGNTSFTKPLLGSSFNSFTIIENDNKILLIMGEKELINTFLEKPLIYENNSNKFLIILNFIFILLVLCWTILGIPLVTTIGQILLGISIVLGLILNMQISLYNNDIPFDRICKKYFNIEEILDDIFEARGTAFGVITLLSNINPDLLLGCELPNTNDWREWSNILKNRKCNENIDKYSFIHDAFSALKYIKDKNFISEIIY